MSQKLYIGNLPYRTTESDVRKFFSKYEPIHSVVLISDRESGRPRGFGFIELEDANADSAIAELSDTMFGGVTCYKQGTRQGECRESSTVQ